MSEKRCAIQKAGNGFVVQAINDYASWCGEPEVFSTFEDAVSCLARKLGENSFAETVKQSQALTVALTDFVSVAVAPKLLAIEAKVFPGIENLVDDEIDLL